jgi:cytochrome c553
VRLSQPEYLATLRGLMAARLMFAAGRLAAERIRFAAGALVAVWLGAGIGATVSAEPYAFFPADAQHGQALAVVCLACHGTTEVLSGTEPPFHVPKLAGQRGEAIFAALLAYKSGQRESTAMQPFVAPLSLQDMRDVAAYLASSGPYVPGTEDVGSWAHEKVRRDCTACHGESGMGVMAGVPVLTGQHEDYLVHALEAYRDGRRSDPSMGPIARALAPDEITRLAAYFARQAHLEPNDAR